MLFKNLVSFICCRVPTTHRARTRSVDYSLKYRPERGLVTHRTPFRGSFEVFGWGPRKNRVYRKYERSGVGAENAKSESSKLLWSILHG